jgi:SOS-response transcriptional repressor LexA
MVTVSQLIGEDPLPNDQAQLSGSTKSRGWNRVPLISWKDAVKWPELQPQQQSATDMTYVSTDAQVSKLAYSLVIKGRAMEPLFPEGTTIIVEPKRKPNNRDFVVVQMPGEEEARLKQVIVDGNEQYLKSLNPALEEVKIMRLSEAGQFLGVMAQAKVDF